LPACATMPVVQDPLFDVFFVKPYRAEDLDEVNQESLHYAG